MTTLVQKIALVTITATLLIMAVFAVFIPDKVQAALIQQKSIRLSNSSLGSMPEGVGVDHEVGMYLPTVSTVGSIELEYCVNDPFPNTSCTTPAGIDLTTATLAPADQTGETGFTIHPDTSNGTYPDSNVILLTRPTALVTPQMSSYLIRNVTNPAVTGTFYVRITSFAEQDGRNSLPTVTRVDEGGIATSTVTQIQLTLQVPPHLTFCVGVAIFSQDCSTATGDFIDMGNFSSNSTATGISKFLTYTNALNGYSVSVIGPTMTSGNNTINNMATRTTSNIGTAQFGMNLRNNSSPNVGLEPAGPGTATATSSYNQVNQFKYVNGDAVVSASLPNDRKTFTASYIVNIPPGQPVGVYSTTITYLALATF